MIQGEAGILSRRMWMVPGVAIWGSADWGEMDFLVVERVGADRSVLFGQSSLGDSTQTLTYAELTDHRGNQLPGTIDSPLVLVRSRSEKPVFVAGRESSESVKVAKSSTVPDPVTADLLVIELGS